jgi:hypothetical protein
MEQAQSAMNPTPASVLEASSDHAILDGAWPREHPKQPSALERRAVSRKQDVDPSQEVLAAHPISTVVSRTEHSHLVAEVPVNSPIVDYSNASEEQLLEAARSSDVGAFVELTARCAQSTH